MRVLLINAVCGIRSTGRICSDIARKMESEGHEVLIAYGRESVPEAEQYHAVRIGGTAGVYGHALMAKVFDLRGKGSRLATKRFLRRADEFDPDILWLHNIHDYFINIELLFDWIKSRPSMEVRWTQHDCWAFTGGCMHFLRSGCEGWKIDCGNCPRGKKKLLPLVNRSKSALALKKRLFTGIPSMTLITPSAWLAGLVKQSFLKDYEVQVVHNTIDTSVFRPTVGDFRKKNGIGDKIMILGVASAWGAGKGLGDFIKLAARLDDRYRIVLVGLKEEQLKTLPENILGIGRTDSPRALAEIYTAADVFFNPTYEDNYPTVNLEAEACGTRVITYDTGGCKETLHRPDSLVIPVGSWESLPDLLAKETV